MSLRAARLSRPSVVWTANCAACRTVLEARRLFLYSSTIETGLQKRTHRMNIALGLRALALLAFVAASTAVIVNPEWIGGADGGNSPLVAAVVALGHH